MAEEEDGTVTDITAKLAEALRECAIVFRQYEQMHLAKGTQDGDEKAHRNHEMAAKCEAALSALPADDALSFQSRVQPWMMACFGAEIAADKLERADRFIEEALELCQTAPGFSIDRAHALVDYVFNRPQGDINQEVGGVMVTLAAFCLAFELDMHGAGETELARVWTKVEQIRAKQAAKPKGSALPIAQEPRS